MRDYRANDRPPLALIAFCLSAAALLVWHTRSRNPHPQSRISEAPLRTLRRRAAGIRSDKTIVGRSVTINKPRQELYAFWRDFSRFPEFVENVKQVRQLDATRYRWLLVGPADSELGFTSILTEDRPGEMIAWRSEDGSALGNSGKVTFRDAPGDRGTQVEVTIGYEAPAGAAGRLIARLSEREPSLQVRRDLKRFKQLMETGEVATSVPGRPAPAVTKSVLAASLR